MSILITLGFIAIVLGIILVLLGYTIAPAAQRPGWGALILGIILVVVGYLVPYVITSDRHSAADSCTVGQSARVKPVAMQ